MKHGFYSDRGTGNRVILLFLQRLVIVKREALGSLRDLTLYALREELGTVTRGRRNERDWRDAGLVDLVF
jgi:hypothetical protein